MLVTLALTTVVPSAKAADVRASQLKQYCLEVFPEDKSTVENLHHQMVETFRSMYSEAQKGDKPELSEIYQKLNGKIHDIEEQIEAVDKFVHDYQASDLAQWKKNLPKYLAIKPNSSTGYSKEQLAQLNEISRERKFAGFIHLYADKSLGEDSLTEDQIKDFIYGTKDEDGVRRVKPYQDSKLLNHFKNLKEKLYDRLHSLTEIKSHYPLVKSLESFTNFLTQSRKECETSAELDETTANPGISAVSNLKSTFQSPASLTFFFNYFFEVRPHELGLEKYEVGKDIGGAIARGARALIPAPVPAPATGAVHDRAPSEGAVRESNK